MLENPAAPKGPEGAGLGQLVHLARDWRGPCPGALSSGGFPSPCLRAQPGTRLCFLPLLGLCHPAPKDTIPCSVH